jgi:hypothetical protein
MLEEDLSDNDLEYFHILELPHFKKNEDRILVFCIYSQKRRLIVRFDSKSLHVEILKIIYNRMEPNIEPVVCASQKLVFTASEKFIEIYDQSFSLKIHSIEISNTVKAFLLIPRKQIILIYDKSK